MGDLLYWERTREIVVPEASVSIYRDISIKIGERKVLAVEILSR